MKRYKPKIRKVGPFTFKGVRYLYRCSGLDWNGYGETIDESYEDWKSVLGLVHKPALVFVWINELIYKVKEYCGGFKQ